MRLFVGVPLPADVRERLSILAAGVPGARWMRPDSFHLTLRFLGEVDGALADDVAGELSRIRCPEFDICVRGVGGFGDRRRTRVLWAGIAGSPELGRLQHKVELALQRAGLEPEHRKYHPHITLARLKDVPTARLERFLSSNGFFQTRSFTVDTFTLFESLPSSEGSFYRPLAEYELDPAMLAAVGSP